MKRIKRHEDHGKILGLVTRLTDDRYVNISQKSILNSFLQRDSHLPTIQI